MDRPAESATTCREGEGGGEQARSIWIAPARRPPPPPDTRGRAENAAIGRAPAWRASRGAFAALTSSSRHEKTPRSGEIHLDLARSARKLARSGEVEAHVTRELGGVCRPGQSVWAPLCGGGRLRVGDEPMGTCSPEGKSRVRARNGHPLKLIPNSVESLQPSGPAGASGGVICARRYSVSPAQMPPPSASAQLAGFGSIQPNLVSELTLPTCLTRPSSPFVSEPRRKRAVGEEDSIESSSPTARSGIS